MIGALTAVQNRQFGQLAKLLAQFGGGQANA